MAKYRQKAQNMCCKSCALAHSVFAR